MGMINVRLKARMAGWLKSNDKGWIQVPDDQEGIIDYKERAKQKNKKCNCEGCGEGCDGSCCGGNCNCGCGK